MVTSVRYQVYDELLWLIAPFKGIIVSSLYHGSTEYPHAHTQTARTAMPEFNTIFMISKVEFGSSIGAHLWYTRCVVLPAFGLYIIL